MGNQHLSLFWLTLGASALAGYNQNAPILPNRALGPGDVLTTDTKLICTPVILGPFGTCPRR